MSQSGGAIKMHASFSNLERGDPGSSATGFMNGARIEKARWS